MFDSKAFEKALLNVKYSDNYKKTFSGGSGFAFSYLSTSKLEDGTYTVRVLPPSPEKCPEGWLKVATHSVLVNQGDQKGTRVECIKEEDTPCAICEALETIADDLYTLPDHLQEIFNKMVSIRKLVLPATIFAQPVRPGDMATTWKKSEKENGAMLEIRAVSTQTELFNLMIADPLLTHHERGRYFQITKRYNMTKVTLPADSKPGPLKTPDLMKQYPHVVNAHFKNVKRIGYQEQQKFLEECFWFHEPKVQVLLKDTFYDNPSSPETAVDDFSFDLA
jgi:hypothetical protein